MLLINHLGPAQYVKILHHILLHVRQGGNLSEVACQPERVWCGMQQRRKNNRVSLATHSTVETFSWFQSCTITVKKVPYTTSFCFFAALESYYKETLVHAKLLLVCTNSRCRSSIRMKMVDVRKSFKYDETNSPAFSQHEQEKEREELWMPIKLSGGPLGPARYSLLYITYLCKPPYPSLYSVFLCVILSNWFIGSIDGRCRFFILNN